MTLRRGSRMKNEIDDAQREACCIGIAQRSCTRCWCTGERLLLDEDESDLEMDINDDKGRTCVDIF